MFKIRTQENKLNHLGSSTTAAHPQQSCPQQKNYTTSAKFSFNNVYL